jgi:hypothetical protein
VERVRVKADGIFNELYDGLVNGIPEKELTVKKRTKAGRDRSSQRRQAGEAYTDDERRTDVKAKRIEGRKETGGGAGEPTLLGDDLYPDYNTCKAVADAGYSFIFTRKEESRPCLTETVKNSYPKEYKRREWTGRSRLEGYSLVFYIKPEDGLQLPKIMQWLKQTFAVRYNLRHGRTGYVWGDRYWSEKLEGEPPEESEKWSGQ